MKIDTRELLERLSTSRREFNATAFAELDRNLSDEEREEWNAIYASFSSRSLLRNTVIGLETIPFPTDENMEQALTCMVTQHHHPSVQPGRCRCSGWSRPASTRTA